MHQQSGGKSGSQVALGKEKKKWSPEIVKMIGRSVVLGSKNNDSVGGTRDLFPNKCFSNVLIFLRLFYVYKSVLPPYLYVWTQ